MICAPNHKNTIVLFQTINFIQKVAPSGICYQAIDVFEDEEAWSCLSGFFEDLSYGILWIRPSGTGKGFDVETCNGLGAFRKSFHDSFDGYRLAAPWRPVKQDASL